jgi:hypothetical protein
MFRCFILWLCCIIWINLFLDLKWNHVCWNTNTYIIHDPEIKRWNAIESKLIIPIRKTKRQQNKIDYLDLKWSLLVEWLFM